MLPPIVTGTKVPEKSNTTWNIFSVNGMKGISTNFNYYIDFTKVIIKTSLLFDMIITHVQLKRSNKKIYLAL